MLETMKMYLKGKIEASAELTRIRTKLHKFLTNNPDVDHYLCDQNNHMTIRGFLLGIAVAFFISFLVIMFLITYWVGMGYLYIPGMRW